MKGEPIRADGYSKQRWVVTGEEIYVPHYPRYKANRRKDTRMPTLKDLVEKGDVNLKATYLSQEEKNALAENGQPFDVLNIGYSEKGRFGPMWTATVALAGEEVEMSFGGATGRDGYMRDMQDVIREHGAIEGVRLVVVGERQGNKILAFAPAEEAADTSA